MVNIRFENPNSRFTCMPEKNVTITINMLDAISLNDETCFDYLRKMKP